MDRIPHLKAISGQIGRDHAGKYLPRTSSQTAALTYALQLNINTSDAEAKMRFLTKELFEMVLDMTITDVTELLHYEWGNATTEVLPSTNNKETDEGMTGAGQD